MLRHSWVSSVLILATACGGMQKSSSIAASGGAPPPSSAGYAATEPSHAAVDRPAQVSPGGYVAEPVPDRPGLGTSWGEQVSAPISYAPFQRSSTSAWAEVALHYNDAEGVQAHASYLGVRPAPLEVYAGDGALSVSLVNDVGRTLPGLTAQGRSLIIGEDGERYRIVVRNATTARFEVVASVDGLDVIDGRPADPNRRGYIVDPHDTLVIDGFRTSDDAVAAFRFGRVAESYAAQTSGDRNVGVVGLAIFSERGATWTVGELQTRDTANPFPQRGYATPPR
ncbi:MAG: hypothetical protein AB7T06_09205 [Kofleriaceae bacterium]